MPALLLLCCLSTSFPYQSLHLLQQLSSKMFMHRSLIRGLGLWLLLLAVMCDASGQGSKVVIRKNSKLSDDGGNRIVFKRSPHTAGECHLLDFVRLLGVNFVTGVFIDAF